jgi:lipopolysaccharide transport system ATP-binding protein
MPDVLVKAESVSKKFCRSLKRSLWYGVTDITRSLIPGSRLEARISQLPELRREEFWALRDVSFEVRRGECLGLVGHNGAGKSTLLKILNGLIRPDAGIVTIRGRVGALIELNAGFNPILSGRENVFHQASLLGFSREETESRFDKIVAFSEVGEFIDMPVQNYSSGMRVRLGFAVASEMEPDVMLIDEVLAVGDVGFRAKCLARMGELRKKSAFIFVSHSMPQIARISTQVMHLHNGISVVRSSNISEGLESYYSTFPSAQKASAGNGEVRLTSIRAHTPTTAARDGQQLIVGWGDDIDIELECEFDEGRTAATVQLLIWNQELVPIADVVGPEFNRVPIHPDPTGHCKIATSISGLQLNSGRFSLSVIILSTDGMTTLAQIDQALELRVVSNLGSGSALLWPTVWTVGPGVSSAEG